MPRQSPEPGGVLAGEDAMPAADLRDILWTIDVASGLVGLALSLLLGAGLHLG
jgi:hypothetical protein